MEWRTAGGEEGKLRTIHFRVLVLRQVGGKVSPGYVCTDGCALG